MLLRPLSVALLGALSVTAEIPDRIDFKRDVQPIFKEHCYSCHGPDEQMSYLRLDRRRDAMRGGTIVVIAPGTSSGSRLFHKITSTRYGNQMPPSGPLAAEKIEILKRWLDQGAQWPDDVSGDPAKHAQDSAASRMMNLLRQADAAAVRKMLAADPGIVNRRGLDGSTPLMYAALYSDSTMVKAMLQAGADAKLRNDNGATALMWAIDDIEKTKLLLDAGADPNARSNEGRTPLAIAVARTGSAPVVKLLIERGAKSMGNPRTPMNDALVGDAQSLAQIAAIEHKPTGLLNAVRLGCRDCVDSVLKFAKPADLAAPLANAALFGDTILFKRFLDMGAPIPKSFLTTAVSTEAASPDIVKILLDLGVDVNGKDTDGVTPLQSALRHGETPVVALLLKAGAQADASKLISLPAPPKPAKSVQEALDRSLPLLRRADDGFLTKAGCVSCHNNSLFAMTIARAKRSGFPAVDADIDRHQKTIGPYIDSWRERALQGVAIPGGADTVTYILTGLAAIGYPADEATDALAHYLLGRQRPDGKWAIQTNRPPIESSSIEVTALSLRALQAYGMKAQKLKYERAIRAAKAWLESAQPVSTEDRVFQLLAFAWAESPRDLRVKAAEALLKQQRPDGGWSQIQTLPSDPYATGQALVALKESGLVKASAPEFQRGISFLLNSQREDGSWYVRSRSNPFQPYFESGYPYGNDQWISAAAGNWATMALLTAR